MEGCASCYERCLSWSTTQQRQSAMRSCRWVQGECRRLGDTDAPEVEPMLQRAASALRERPVLFKFCAAEVAGARHNALFQRCALPDPIPLKAPYLCCLAPKPAAWTPELSLLCC